MWISIVALTRIWTRNQDTLPLSTKSEIEYRLRTITTQLNSSIVWNCCYPLYFLQQDYLQLQVSWKKTMGIAFGYRIRLACFYWVAIFNMGKMVTEFSAQQFKINCRWCSIANKPKSRKLSRFKVHRAIVTGLSNGLHTSHLKQGASPESTV